MIKCRSSVTIDRDVWYWLPLCDNPVRGSIGMVVAVSKSMRTWLKMVRVKVPYCGIPDGMWGWLRYPGTMVMSFERVWIIRVRWLLNTIFSVRHNSLLPLQIREDLRRPTGKRRPCHLESIGARRLVAPRPASRLLRRLGLLHTRGEIGGDPPSRLFRQSINTERQQINQIKGRFYPEKLFNSGNAGEEDKMGHDLRASNKPDPFT